MIQVPVIKPEHINAANDAIGAMSMELSFNEAIAALSNKAIEIFLAEQEELENEANESINQLVDQDMQNKFISPDEARALGAGNAEWQHPDNHEWHACIEHCRYAEYLVYRAIRKEVPAEPQVSLDPAIREGVIALLQELGLSK